MTCVARRTRSQTKKSSGFSPPAADRRVRRCRRIARKNVRKSEALVLSSEGDDNEKEEEENEEEESGFAGEFVATKGSLSSRKGTEGMEASLRGSSWEEASGSTSVRESVPSCCRRRKDAIHLVGGDDDGDDDCDSESDLSFYQSRIVEDEAVFGNRLVQWGRSMGAGRKRGRKEVLKTSNSTKRERHSLRRHHEDGKEPFDRDDSEKVEDDDEGDEEEGRSSREGWTDSLMAEGRNSPSVARKDVWQFIDLVSSDDDGFREKKFVGRECTSRRKTDEESLTKGNFAMNQAKKKNNLLGREVREEEQTSETEFEEESNDGDENDHEDSDADDVTNYDDNNPFPETYARRGSRSGRKEVEISRDATLGREDENDDLDGHVVCYDDEQDMQKDDEEEETGRLKKKVLRRENRIIWKNGNSEFLDRMKHGRSSNQGVSIAIKRRFKGKGSENLLKKVCIRYSFSASKDGAQGDASDNFNKRFSTIEAKVAEDCNDGIVHWRLLNNCVARRTRSNFKKTLSGEFGTFSKPICIDMNEARQPLVHDDEMHCDGSGSSQQIDDGGDAADDGNDYVADQDVEDGFADDGRGKADIKISGKQKGCFDDCLGDAECVTDGSADKGMDWKMSRKHKCDYIDDDSSSNDDDSDDDLDDECDGCPDIEMKKYPEGTSGNEKTKHASTDVSLFDLLVDTISQKMVAFPDDVKPSEEESSNKENELPLRFSFRDLQNDHVKSDSEEELAGLWDELTFVLGCEAIGSSDSHEMEVKPKWSMLNSESKSPSCQHQFFLDEQIGTICRICGFVKIEIKHNIAPMVSGIFGKQSKKASHEEGNDSVLDGFDCEEFSGCSDISNGFACGTVWDIIPDLRAKMFRHQREGFEFIWKNLAGGIVLEHLNSNSDGVGGCLISHAPGSGKTFLTIAFLRSFLQQFADCRPMIVAPVNLLPVWEGEFRKWGIGMPFHVLNGRGFSGKESSSALELFGRQSKLDLTGRKNLCRVIKIFSWMDRKSVLLISYGLFRKLTIEKQRSDKEGQAIRKLLLECPGLLVLDEGHTARNRFSRIWQCLKRVKTQRRIMLSGTPFQNNFDELFNTLYLIRPRFAEGIFQRFRNHVSCLEADPIEKDWGLQDKNETMFRRTFATFSGGIEPEQNSSRLKELRLIIDPFVHVHEGNLCELPGLRDYFIYLSPSSLQRCILEKLTERGNLENNYRVSCISVHPSILLEMEIKDEKDQDVIKEHQSDLSSARINDGVKVRFVIELVRLCAALGEKVLVFSQFVLPLSKIKTYLISSLGWTDGREVLQLDGGIAQKHRQPIIHTFNHSQEVKVLLVSTEVCAEGMDLTGASRVALLDLAWNPSVRRQVIGRAYRIGQQKVVYTYNLIAASTLEEKKHKIQDTKHKFSQLVFSTVNKNDTLVDTLKQCDDKVLCELIERDRSASLFHRVLVPKCGQELEVE